ncbi:nucleotidylyl transferase superfamily protein [Striga asiatica]|uniref:Nucleotidylyl transferase superfamily protein n=1 Tax=Striga asiatica TaxID=4170 RepID=A0A5A7QLZ7_STRAF|nr:nucleotidylyl transferase superfamily protein [Striga asiatica]
MKDRVVEGHWDCNTLGFRCWEWAVCFGRHCCRFVPCAVREVPSRVIGRRTRQLSPRIAYEKQNERARLPAMGGKGSGTDVASSSHVQPPCLRLLPMSNHHCRSPSTAATAANLTDTKLTRPEEASRCGAVPRTRRPYQEACTLPLPSNRIRSPTMSVEFAQQYSVAGGDVESHMAIDGEVLSYRLRQFGVGGRNLKGCKGCCPAVSEAVCVQQVVVVFIGQAACSGRRAADGGRWMADWSSPPSTLLRHSPAAVIVHQLTSSISDDELRMLGDSNCGGRRRLMVS